MWMESKVQPVRFVWLVHFGVSVSGTEKVVKASKLPALASSFATSGRFGMKFYCAMFYFGLLGCIEKYLDWNIQSICWNGTRFQHVSSRVLTLWLGLSGWTNHNAHKAAKGCGFITFVHEDTFEEFSQNTINHLNFIVHYKYLFCNKVVFSWTAYPFTKFNILVFNFAIGILWLSGEHLELLCDI